MLLHVLVFADSRIKVTQRFFFRPCDICGPLFLLSNSPMKMPRRLLGHRDVTVIYDGCDGSSLLLSASPPPADLAPPPPFSATLAGGLSERRPAGAFLARRAAHSHVLPVAREARSLLPGGRPHVPLHRDEQRRGGRWASVEGRPLWPDVW